MVSIDGRIDLSQYALTDKQKSALSKARTADQIVQALTEDGRLDQEEQKLLDEIMQELSQSSDHTLKLAHGNAEANTVLFGKPADFQGRLQQTLSQNTQRLLRGSTADRARFFAQIDNQAELSRILQADQLVVDGYSKYGAHVLNGKILLQDACLLGRFSLLAPEELQFIQDILHQCNKSPRGIGILDAKQVEILDNIVERAIARLDGKTPPPSLLEAVQKQEATFGPQSLPERFLIDEPALARGEDFSALQMNYDNLLAASDAAIQDAQLAVSETGLNAEQMKQQKASAIEGGYTYRRVQQAIKELDHQSHNLDRALELANRQIESLRQEIEARTRSLQEQGQAPEQDPTLGFLKSTLEQVVTQMETLLNKAQEIHTTRQRVLFQAKARNIVATETDKRLAALGEAQQHLARGCQVLESVRTQTEKIAQEAANNPEAAKAELAKFKEVVSEINEEMIQALKKLIAVYEQSPTANKRALELLRAEVKTLEALKSQDDVQGKVQALTASRARILQAMQPMVAEGLLDYRELRQLTTLDRQVTDFSGTHFAATGDLKVYNTSIEQMIEAGKRRQEDLKGHTSLLEDHKSWLGKHIGYGSHVQMRLNITGGVGGHIGIAHGEVGAGITAGVRFAREFVGDPNREYQLRFDVGVMAEASAGIKGLFELDAEFRASLQGGLAFASVGEVEQFMQLFADGASAVLQGKTDEAQAKLAAMKAMMASKAFTGRLTGVEVTATVELPGHHNELVFRGTEQTAAQTYADGAQNTTTTYTVGGKVELGHAAFGIKYTDETARFTPQGSHQPIESHHKTIHVSFSVAMLDKLLKTRLQHGKFGHALEAMDPKFKEALVAAISRFGGDAGRFLGALDSPQALQKLSEMIRLAKVKGETEIMLGFEWEPHTAIEIGLEGEYRAAASMNVGPGYAKIGGKASYELSVVIPVGGHHDSE